MIKTKVFTVIISWLLLAITVSGCGGSTSPPIIRKVVSETPVTQVVDKYSSMANVPFSSDARRVAYITDRGGKRYVVIDGVFGKKGYDYFESPPVFSPDSKRVAYIGITYGQNPRTDRRYFVVIDGEEGAAYSNASSVTFSLDSQHVAYVADNLVFLDGVRVKGPESIPRSAPLFSPDSQHLAYIVERSGGGKCVVLDGIPGKLYGLLGTMAFSPDSKHLAYRAMIGNQRWVMVVDGNEVSQYESDEWHLQDITFSPDSKHLAYVAGEYVQGAKFREHRQFIVLDGKELRRHNEVTSKPVFSPDSNHLAYNADGFIFVDGVEKGAWKGGFIGSVFSPDSTRLAYVDVETSFWSDGITGAWVVVDGVKDKKYRSAGHITFSPDSKHVAYIASQGKKEFVIVDGTRGKEYDQSYTAWSGPKRIVWDSVDRFHYLVQKGNSIYLVEESIIAQ